MPCLPCEARAWLALSRVGLVLTATSCKLSRFRKGTVSAVTDTKAMASKVDRDAWKQIQQRAFTNWFNDRLRGNLKVAKVQVEDLKTDLRDGLLIITLLEQLAKPRKVGRYNKTTTNKLHCIENLGVCFRFTKSENIKFVNIGKRTRD